MPVANQISRHLIIDDQNVFEIDIIDQKKVVKTILKYELSLTEMITRSMRTKLKYSNLINRREAVCRLIYLR